MLLMLQHVVNQLFPEYWACQLVRKMPVHQNFTILTPQGIPRADDNASLRIIHQIESLSSHTFDKSSSICLEHFE